MTELDRPFSYGTRITLFFWANVLAGLTLPGVVAIAVEVLRDRASLAAALDEWISHLFLPGYNEFLLAVLHAAPFSALAVVGLFALTKGWKRGQRDFQVRFVAAVSSLAVASTLSLWMLISIRISRSSTAAIGYIFLPILISSAVPFAWFGGWLLGRRLFPAGPSQTACAAGASPQLPADSSPPASS